VTVEKAAVLRGFPGVAADPTPVRARAWREACGGPEHALNSSGLCLHIIVVNLAQDSPASFTLQLAPGSIAGSGEAFPLTASRLFDSGGYDVQTTAEGQLHDFVDSGDTVVYEIGCNGVRYVAGGSGGRNASGGISSLSCSSRRVDCVHGFPATDPRHARCAQRTGPTTDLL
jgi:hypothetical protein